MPVAVEIKVNPQQLRELESELGAIKGGLNRALSSAINKTVAQGRTVAIQMLADTLTVKKSNIRARTDTKKASPKNLAGAIKILGRRIGLINFKYKDTGKGKGRNRKGKGVFVQAYKAGVPEIFPKAFVATGKSANKHIFRRRGSAGRLPIDSLKGLSLLDVYKKTPGIQQATQKKIADIFAEKLRSASDWVLNKRKTSPP